MIGGAASDRRTTTGFDSDKHSSSHHFAAKSSLNGNTGGILTALPCLPPAAAASTGTTTSSPAANGLYLLYTRVVKMKTTEASNVSQLQHRHDKHSSAESASQEKCLPRQNEPSGHAQTRILC